MAKSASGKWVSRVGSSGGSKAYKKERPSNYYAVLVLIVVIGFGSVVWARYDYQHPAAAAAGTPPAVGTTWFSAVSVEACGESLPYLTTDASSGIYGLKTLSDNVIEVSPLDSSDAGHNANLGQYAVETPGMRLTSSEIVIPTSKGVANPKTTYKNGELCPASSKYPKKAAQVVYAYWNSFTQKTPTLTTNPATIRFAQDQRITLAFVPKGVTPTPPSTTTVNAMVSYIAASATTTTTTGVTTSTVAPTTTTTSKATTTTTSKG